MRRVRELIALCERLIVDMRDVIAALERGDVDGAIAKFGEAARRMEDHASELANTPKEEQ
jgi:hypothetical protein